MKKKAFTLIELLVVISIIAILMAIMMPALSRAREGAKSVVCRSRLKQLELAHSLYVQDNDSLMSFWIDRIFITTLAPYLSDIDEVRFCPVANKVLYDTDWLDPSADYKYRHGSTKSAWRWGASETGFLADRRPQEGSFGMNTFMFSPQGGTPGREGGYEKAHMFTTPFPSSWWQRQENISPANEVPIFADCVYVTVTPQNNNPVPSEVEIGENNIGIGRVCMDRHNMAVNVVFADGHSRPVKLSDLWSLQWHRTWNKKYDVEVGR
jgi:prepilin-type N-terminal cleavage/methylation domain-containing protein/prepilin-type processing-associated H-X9-DG protein